jgi:anthraniloyl-CoA monooxygenase
MTVGAIASAEDANTIIAAGRAALCCLARPHLVDPYRTLDAAIEQDYRGHVPPKRYRPGRGARRRAQEP